MREHKSGSAGDTVLEVFEIEQGGTGATTEAEALENLGGLSETDVNQPGMLIQLDESGQVPVHMLRNVTDNSVSLSGPDVTRQGSDHDWTITNFDSLSDYTVSVNYGHVTLTGDNIHLYLPTTEQMASPLKLNVARNRNTRFLELPLIRGVNTSLQTNRQTTSDYKVQNTSFNTQVQTQADGSWINTTYGGTRLTYLYGSHNTVVNTAYNTSHQTLKDTAFQTSWVTYGYSNNLTSYSTGQNTNASSSSYTSYTTIWYTTGGWHTYWNTSVSAWGGFFYSHSDASSWAVTINAVNPSAIVRTNQDPNWAPSSFNFSVSWSSAKYPGYNINYGVAGGFISLSSANEKWISGRVDGIEGGEVHFYWTSQLGSGGSQQTSVYTTDGFNTSQQTGHYTGTSSLLYTSWITSHNTSISVSWNTSQNTSRSTMVDTTYQTNHNTNRSTANTSMSVGTSWKTSAMTMTPATVRQTTYETARDTVSAESSWYTQHNTTVQTADEQGNQLNTSWATDHMTTGPGSTVNTRWTVNKNTTVNAYPVGTEWTTTRQTSASDPSQNTAFTTTHQTYVQGNVVNTSTATQRETIVPGVGSTVQTQWDTTKTTEI